ncbi:hypothetical protein HC752_02250 [Vibrio sp. S9_S30]|nr:hypothetical protein [Vibrio sp. S9_S30]MBD1555757.1 hypothetical protein [Vibrio sp. S9_S30]
MLIRQCDATGSNPIDVECFGREQVNWQGSKDCDVNGQFFATYPLVLGKR